MAHVAATAAAHHKRLEEEEEETMAYSDSDLAEGWEFKIVRSVTGEFGKQRIFETVVEEEARAGWELLEKFDHYRIRFKRPASARANDVFLAEGIDPYRTQYGWSDARLAFMIIGVIMVVIVVIMLAVATLGNGF